MSRRATIELGDNNERIIDTLIEKGIYKTKIEAIRAAVTLNMERSMEYQHDRSCANMHHRAAMEAFEKEIRRSKVNRSIWPG